MKNYEEMAEHVFQRRDQYHEKKRITMRRLKKGLIGIACCCLAAVMSVSAVRGNEVNQAEQENSTWLSADDILNTGHTVYMGVFVPTFLSWQGGFYGSSEPTAEDRFAPTEEEVWFNPQYRYPIYQVQNRPDCFAISINGGLQVYQKLFDVTFQVDDVTYGIQYRSNMNTKYAAGDEILSENGFTVYETETQGYLVNIRPLLQERLPNLFFDESENYSEAWQMALPLQEP